VNLEFAGATWSVRQRYVLKKSIGKGISGVVVSATDSQTNCSAVAIKKVDFLNQPMRTQVARQILREVRLMHCMKHPNIITLLDIMLPPVLMHSLLSSRQPLLSELYIVTELMSTDLYQILSAAQCPSTIFFLKLGQVQYLLYQLMCGVQYMSSAGVIHRDLKPSNLLIDLRSCQLRICDFGLARAIPRRRVGSFQGKMKRDTLGLHDPMTEYVVTRCYRAPELLLGNAHYGPGIDIWSVGCIMAEMLAPSMGILFRGKERRETLTRIASILGRPSTAELWFVANTDAYKFMNSLPLVVPGALRKRILPHCHCTPPESAVRPLH